MTVTTPAVMQDELIWPRLTELLGCLCSTLADRGLPEPCVCTVMPGLTVATDYCSPCGGDKCGMAWTRLVTVYPSTVFPQPDTVASGCATLLGFEVELGVARCAPVGDEHGNPPSSAELQACAQLQVNDMMALRAAAKCCFTAGKTMMGQYQPFGPAGGCVGGTWNVAAEALPYLVSANGHSHKGL